MLYQKHYSNNALNFLTVFCAFFSRNEIRQEVGLIGGRVRLSDLVLGLIMAIPTLTKHYNGVILTNFVNFHRLMYSR
jgi:hypothetical protein